MSGQARAIIVDVLNRSHLWAKTLSESHREDTTDRVAKIADKLARAPGAQPPRAPRLGGYGGLDALGSGAAPSARADQAPLSKAADAAAGVATEALHGRPAQLTKRLLAAARLPARGALAPGAQRAGREAVRLGPPSRVLESATLLRISARPVEARAQVLERVVEERPFVLAFVPGKMHDEVAGLVRRARAATLALGPDARRGRTKYAFSAHWGTTLMWDRVRGGGGGIARGTFVGDRAAHLRHAAVSVK